MINRKSFIKPNLEWFSDASKKHTSITVSLESCEGNFNAAQFFIYIVSFTIYMNVVNVEK